jgi:hydroxymethylglutaryl-CoA reductase
MSDSRISGLYRLSIAERIGELQRLGFLSATDAELLRQGRHTLRSAQADKMTENVVGVFGLPFAIAPNFIVNGEDYIVPMVVEEPSVVAAVSAAAGMARATGGFASSCSESLLIGQVHVSGVANADAGIERLDAAENELLKLCNSVHPRLTERGGGVREIYSRKLKLADDTDLIAVHLLVDTRDAMGANLVNTICESVAPRIGELCSGDVALRILSNLADRSLVTARVRYTCDELGSKEFSAEQVRDRIVLASDIAMVDPYRAATHNKGIMNGVDAVAIATGNDWRAIEAGAHAFAASSGRYLPLATWSADDDGDLIGEIVIPLKVGTVGGNLDANDGAAFGLRVSGVGSSHELAALIASVGLAQNFAALRALATSGIQEGHMKLHARSVASTANVPEEIFDDVVAELVAEGEVKVWRAEQLAAARRPQVTSNDSTGFAAGKVILLGEHGVVYGKHALAVPITGAISADVSDNAPTAMIRIPEWNVTLTRGQADASGIAAAVALIEKELGIAGEKFSINLHSKLPRAMGLGSSAAFAVAITRAFNHELSLGLDDAAINAVAFACEKLAHGTPSGIDNTIATYSEAMLFQNDGELETDIIALRETPPLVIACSSQAGLTKEQVANVRARHERNAQHYDAIFDAMDALSQDGAEALRGSDYVRLGQLMNICHGLLNSIEVSTPELESMVSIARAAGAAGAKVTGGGGGGSIVALCPGVVSEVRAAFVAAGFRTISLV